LLNKLNKNTSKSKTLLQLTFNGKTTKEPGEAEITQKTRSKLETYLETLDSLAHKAPTNPSNIINKPNVTHCTHGNCLAFLVKQGLVEERTVEMDRVLYVVTKRGIGVLNFFAER
jgi:predicted transcriptional regulator